MHAAPPDFINLSYAGAHFHLSDSQDPNQVFNLKLSSDHKQLLVDNDHLPINMRHILEVKSLTGDQLPIMDQGSKDCDILLSESLCIYVYYLHG